MKLMGAYDHPEKITSVSTLQPLNMSENLDHLHEPTLGHAVVHAHPPLLMLADVLVRFPHGTDQPSIPEATVK